ncbi:MAG TPA: isoprenylcysteine carboxylmethyltransferase family protein, partial [Thermoanaerobaculia bacterium]|nr:isoprenylcysteine carboxylmethyltransferase family protein [Thermoanaerobaculia bacterium]
TITDWIYVSHHLLVLGIALTRGAPKAQDRSILVAVAVAVAYGYPYAQIIYLKTAPGSTASPTAGLVMVTAGAGLGLASLIALGRRFGIRPAWRGLMTKGPYRLVRHPMYLSYFISDIGYNLQEWNIGTVLLTLAGWASLIYRIHAEERMLSQDPAWSRYSAAVRYRLLPAIW